jgi:DNA-binding cell septation regulator SpoVG
MVVKERYSARVSLDDYVKAGLKSLDQMEGLQRPVEHKRIRTSSGEFERLQYHVKVSNNDNLIVVYQLVGVNGNMGYIVTMSASEDQAAKYGPIFDHITQTFQLK